MDKGRMGKRFICIGTRSDTYDQYNPWSWEIVPYHEWALPTLSDKVIALIATEYIKDYGSHYRINTYINETLLITREEPKSMHVGTRLAANNKLKT